MNSDRAFPFTSTVIPAVVLSSPTPGANLLPSHRRIRSPHLKAPVAPQFSPNTQGVEEQLEVWALESSLLDLGPQARCFTALSLSFHICAVGCGER